MDPFLKSHRVYYGAKRGRSPGNAVSIHKWFDHVEELSTWRAGPRFPAERRSMTI